MTLETFIKDRLLGYAGLSALVGTRISPMKSLQGAVFPCVTMLRAGGGRDYDQDGLEEMAESKYQFDCWHSNGDGTGHDEAVAVARQVCAALDTGESPPAGFYCFIDNESHGYESDTKIHRVMIETTLWFRQAAP